MRHGQDVNLAKQVRQEQMRKSSHQEHHFRHD